MQFYFLTLSEAKQMINKRSYKLVVIFTIILTLFINMAVASLAASLEDIQSQITHQQANKNELKNELAGLRAEIEAQKKEDAKITAEMAAILAQKQEQATIVEQMLDDLDNIYEQIEGYYNSIQQAEEEYNEALKKFYTRARIMYRYTQYDSLRLFVEAEDIFDYANRDKLFSRMMENDREAIRGLLVMKQDLESKKQIQEQLKVDAEALLLEKQEIIEAIEKNEKIVAEKLEASRGSLAILEAQESKIEAESYKIESELAWEIACEHYKFNQVKPGYYEFPVNIAPSELINRLKNGRETPINLSFSESIRTPEQLAKRMGEKLMIDSAEVKAKLDDSVYLAKYNMTLETAVCLFIPNTYEVYWAMSVDELFERMHKEYNDFWNEERLAKAQKLELTPMEVSTLASIIASETNNSSEYPTIASLYLNRIRTGMKLQACPTVIYAVGDFTLSRVLNKHLEIDSPYNTYKYKGLPPGPIRLARPDIMDAVLNAPNTDYLYMCANPDFSGTHIF